MAALLFILLSIPILLILNPEKLMSQLPITDSVYVEIIRDTVIIWDKNVFENCGSIFTHEVTIDNNSIALIEKDTSTN